MTIIELLDEERIENILSSVLFEPDEVIFVGLQSEVDELADNLERFIRSKRSSELNDINFGYMILEEYDYLDIADGLSAIINEGTETIYIDITGGSKHALMAYGYLKALYPDRVEPIEYVIEDGLVYEGGELCAFPITLDEWIRLYGARITYEKDKTYGCHKWALTDDDMADIDRLWNICKADIKTRMEWNAQITVFAQYIRPNNTKNDPLEVSAWIPTLKSEYGAVWSSGSTFERLEKAGMITDFEIKPDHISFRYKNDTVKRCLDKAGTILEMKIYSLASRLANADGEYIFADALTGVLLDWDGVINKNNDGPVDVENEIDVILLRDIIPTFVSCKNGHVTPDELYKFKVVAERFGGKHAKKVLVCSKLDFGKANARDEQAFRLRAHEFGIEIIDDVYAMTDEILGGLLDAFC